MVARLRFYSVVTKSKLFTVFHALSIMITYAGKNKALATGATAHGNHKTTQIFMHKETWLSNNCDDLWEDDIS